MHTILSVVRGLSLIDRVCFIMRIWFLPALALCFVSIYSQENPNAVEIHYWAMSGELRTLPEIFEQYERDHPGVKIITGQSAARDLVSDPQRVLCSIVGGEPPDIIVFDRYAVGEWASRGAFMALDEFVQNDAGRPDGIRKEDYYAPCWEEAMYE